MNVFPAAIAARLAAHPGVAAAQVRQMAAAAGGRLKALVVPADPATGPATDRARLRAELARWIATSLAPAERPRALTLADAIPRSPHGKEADWEPGPGDGLADGPGDDESGNAPVESPAGGIPR